MWATPEFTLDGMETFDTEAVAAGSDHACFRPTSASASQLTAQNAKFAAQNAQLATQIAQLRALVLHPH
jgi:hypothetical protein